MYPKMKSAFINVAEKASVAKVSTLPHVHVINATQVR